MNKALKFFTDYKQPELNKTGNWKQHNKKLSRQSIYSQDSYRKIPESYQNVLSISVIAFYSIFLLAEGPSSIIN